MWYLCFETLKISRTFHPVVVHIPDLDLRCVQRKISLQLSWIARSVNYKKYYIETLLNGITWLMITSEHVRIIWTLTVRFPEALHRADGALKIVIFVSGR